MLKIAKSSVEKRWLLKYLKDLNVSFLAHKSVFYRLEVIGKGGPHGTEIGIDPNIIESSWNSKMKYINW